MGVRWSHQLKRIGNRHFHVKVSIILEKEREQWNGDSFSEKLREAGNTFVGFSLFVVFLFILIERGKKIIWDSSRS